MNKHLKSVAGYVLVLAAGLGGGYVVAHAPAWLKPNYTEGNYSAYFPDAQTKVVLYGTSWCPHCADARAYLHKQNVKFVDLDVEKNPTAGAQYKQLGGEGVPTILVGNRRIQGFNADAIEAALQKLDKPSGT
jgi:glutaredoxin